METDLSQNSLLGIGTISQEALKREYLKAQIAKVKSELGDNATEEDAAREYKRRLEEQYKREHPSLFRRCINYFKSIFKKGGIAVTK